NVGYRPDTSIFQELQVHLCYASEGPMKLAATLLSADGGGDCLAQTSGGVDTLMNPEPNFFVLGAKSYGRNSDFLLKLGLEQIDAIFDTLG
ncbi:MAG: flavoprotein, partial [Bradymonadaceae bacterium]